MNIIDNTYENNIRAYNAVQKNSKKYTETVDITALYPYLLEITTHILKKYNAVWCDLALYKEDDILNGALEILGDVVFSRFFTNNTGVIRTNYDRVRLAYEYVLNYLRALKSVERGTQTALQVQVLNDVGSKLFDIQTVAEEMDALLSYTYYVDIMKLAEQVERYKDINAKSYYAYLIPFNKQLATFFIDVATEGSLYRYNIDVYDIFIDVLHRYIDDPVLLESNTKKGAVYIGLDSVITAKYLDTIIDNSNLYYTGALTAVLRKFNTLDRQVLLDEINEKKKEKIGAVVEQIRQTDKRAHMCIADGDLYVKFSTKKQGLCTELIKAHNLEVVDVPCKETIYLT